MCPTAIGLHLPKRMNNEKFEEIFAVTNNQNQLEANSNQLDQFSTTKPASQSTTIFIPIRRSDHLLISMFSPIYVEPTNHLLRFEFGTFLPINMAYGKYLLF